jgi:hypothetical protein
VVQALCAEAAAVRSNRSAVARAIFTGVMWGMRVWQVVMWRAIELKTGGGRTRARPRSSLGSPLIATKIFVVTDAAAAVSCRAESAAACAPWHHGERVEAALARHNSVTVDLVDANSVLGRLREHRRGDAHGSHRDEGKFGNAGHYLSPDWKRRKALCPLASAHEIELQRRAFHHGCVRTIQTMRAVHRGDRMNPIVELMARAAN